MKMFLIILVLMLVHPVLGVLPNEYRDAWIQYYHSQGHTWIDICGFLHVLHKTVVSLSQLKRILKRFGLQRRNFLSPLPDILHAIRTVYERGFGDCGYRTLWKIINVTTNVRVTHDIVRRFIKIIDPEGVEMRARSLLRRRTYVNKGPNYSLHVDGYDKLKPNGIAIHCAIDGFSRKMLWLQACYANNDPRIVAGYYLEFIKTIGRVPRLVRGDACTENVLIRDMQIALRYGDDDNMSGVNSYLSGRSTSNQRIERFWGNLRLGFKLFWRNYFKDMADRGCLHIDDPVHLECLRFCFLPIIQRDLDSFASTWNLHRIRHQGHSEVPAGIPDILYHQPENYGTFDFSFLLPCDVETINRKQDIYTVKKPNLGCTEQFVPVLEELCEVQREHLPQAVTIETETELFRVLTEILDNF